MEIIREGYPSIKKRKISFKDLQVYDKEKIKEASILLQDTINNYPISTFGMITILRNKYNNSLIETYKALETHKNYEQVKYNCYYLSKVLQRKLKLIDIEPFFMTHKAHYFALNSGDKKMKEAHISLIYPTIKDGNILYTIFDPGLKIERPLSFFKESEMVSINENQLSINIKKNKDNKYPYYISLDGINPYSYNLNSHNVFQSFNPEYETVNLDELAYPISYRLLIGYKATNFSKNIKNRAYITLNHLSKTLEFYDGEDNIKHIYSFYDIVILGKCELKNRLKSICYKLSLDVDEIVANIYFMVDVVDEFNTQLMDHDVVNEYNKIMVMKK